MKYLEFHFTLQPASADFADILEAVLADIGFESFVKEDDSILQPADLSGTTGDIVYHEEVFSESQTLSTSSTLQPASHDTQDDNTFTLTAYLPMTSYDADALQTALEAFPVANVHIDYTFKEVEDENWNAVWEKNYFQPLVVDDQCIVSAPFHTDVPRKAYNILINPRMSFGTGHHETTRLMIHELLSVDLKEKEVLDMGCGTSILAILAALRGARHVTAIDVDEWCVENSCENLRLNHVDNVDVYLGDANLLVQLSPASDSTNENSSMGIFDFILANIHLNIILTDMPAYVRVLRRGGTFLTSGFYHNDLSKLQAQATHLGLRFLRFRTENDWCCAAFIKE